MPSRWPEAYSRPLFVLVLLLAVLLPAAALGTSAPQWSYRAYANDVRVVKPLVGDFQLGTSNSRGSGVGLSGSVGTTFTPKNRAKYGGPYSFTASVNGYRFSATAHNVTKKIVLAITVTSTNAPKCAAGDTGTLTLIDSSKKLSNGERRDKARYAWDNGRCPGFVQGWDNTDGGPKTSPQHGGPPHGGNWAIVSISSG